MLNESINIENISIADGNELNIRTGALPEIQVRQSFCFAGDIGTVYNYLMERYDDEVAENGVLLVEKEKNSISLEIDPKNKQAGSIRGRLTVAKEVALLGLEKELGFEDFRKHIKRLRRLFASDEAFNSLMHSLNNFRAKATIEIENVKDNRGGLKNSVERIADTDLIVGFSVLIPLFYGEGEIRLEIDLNYDLQGQSLIFWLECHKLTEEMEVYSFARINEELEKMNFLRLGNSDVGFTVPILFI